MTKRRYKKKAIPSRLGEGVTKERRKKNGGIITETIDRDNNGRAIIQRQRAVAECVLDVYYLREVIDDAEYQAGMKFRKAYLRYALNIKVDDSGTGSHGDPEMSSVIVSESQRIVREAFDVLNDLERSVIIAVCGDDWAGGDYRFTALHHGLAKLVAKWKIAGLPL